VVEYCLAKAAVRVRFPLGAFNMFKKELDKLIPFSLIFALVILTSFSVLYLSREFNIVLFGKAAVCILGTFAVLVMNKKFEPTKVDTGIAIFTLFVMFSFFLSQSKRAFLLYLVSYLFCISAYYIIISFVRTKEDLLLTAKRGAIMMAVLSAAGIAKFILTYSDFCRLSMFFIDQNLHTALLVSAIPVILFFAETEKRILVKRAYYIAFIICTANIYLTGSRGGWVALAAITPLLLWFYKESRQVIIFGLLITFLVYSNIVPYECGIERVRSVFSEMGLVSQGNAELAFGSSRVHTWEIGLAVFSNNILGVGAGNFKIAASQYELFYSSSVNNTYLNSLIEFGIHGGIAFAALIIICLSSFTTIGEIRDRRLSLNIAVLIGFASFLVSGFFLNIDTFMPFWIFIGFAAVAEKINKQV
jgi:hypothetical protein